MPKNPFTDVWQFLTATTGDYLHQGNWRYLILALFWALLLASIAVAFRSWQEHVVEAAAAGVRWPAILDRAGIDQRRL